MGLYRVFLSHCIYYGRTARVSVRCAGSARAGLNGHPQNISIVYHYLPTDSFAFWPRTIGGKAVTENPPSNRRA